MKNKLFGLAAVAAVSLTLMTGCPSGGGSSTGGNASGTASSTATSTATTTAPAGGTSSSTASTTAPAGGASGTASGTTKTKTTKTTKTGAAESTTKVASVEGFDAKSTFQQKCAGCHGANGGGGMCPSLIGVSKRRSDDFIVHRITVGSAEKGMPAFGKQLTPDQIKAMAAYVKTL